MSYDYKKCHVPNTLKALRKEIKRFKYLARSERKSLYRDMNKKYKNLDWSKKQFEPKQIVDSVNDEQFKCYRRMKMDGQIKSIKSNNKYKIQRQNLQGVFLLRQISVSMQNKYMILPKHVKRKPVQYSSLYFDSAYIGRYYICAYPKTLEWKEPLLIEYLKTKEFLFDETSPFFKGYEKTRRFIEKSLMKGSVEKWDFHLQRFLAKND